MTRLPIAATLARREASHEDETSCRRRSSRPLVLALPLASPVEGQGVGGLIRRKAAEAAKGKKAEPTRNDSKADGPITLTAECEISEASISRFERGLETELRLRSEFEVIFSGLRTQEQVVACRQKEAIGPAVQSMHVAGHYP